MSALLLTIIISIAVLIFVFRSDLERPIKGWLSEVEGNLWQSWFYVIFTIYAVFVVVALHPPWSLPSVIVTVYAIIGQKSIATHRVLHFVAGLVIFGAGLALYQGVIGNAEIKNEIVLFGHYVDISYEIGPMLYFSALPIFFSVLWQSLVLLLIARKPYESEPEP